MTTTPVSGDGSELPLIPAPRDVRCPLAPPAEFGDWRDFDGLQLASWRGRPTWVVSRYQDIRAALIDPCLSAETIPDSLKATSPDDIMAVIFPRIGRASCRERV